MSGKSQTKKHRTGRKLKGFTEVYDENRDGPKNNPKQKDETVTYNKSWAEMVGGTPTGQEVHRASNGDSLINEDGTMTTNDPLKDKNLDNAGFEIINEDEEGDDIESDMNTDPEHTDENESLTNETPAKENAVEPESASDQPEDDADGEDESDDEEEDEPESESDEDVDEDEAEEEEEDTDESDDEDGSESETEVEVLPDDESDEDEIENDDETQESSPDPDEIPSDNSDDDEDADEDEDEDEDDADETAKDEDEDTDKSDEDEEEAPPVPESDNDTEADQSPMNRIIPIPSTPARRHPVQKKKKSLFKLNIGKGHAKKKKEDSPPKEKVPLKRKWHEWWFGTDEHPVKPFSFKGKLTRWFLKTFCGYVDYITTMYDKPLDEIRCDVELVKKSKVPREAVHVTNMKRTYHLDLDLPIRYFDVTRDYGFTASSAYNYARDNSITDAMAIDIDNDKPPMDTGKILLIVALVFGAVLAIWFMWPMYAH